MPVTNTDLHLSDICAKR